jgi:hypothetical protein
VPHLTEFGNSLDGELFTLDSSGNDAIRRPVNEELVSAWQAWAPDAPDELTGSRQERLRPAPIPRVSPGHLIHDEGEM